MAWFNGLRAGCRGWIHVFRRLCWCNPRQHTFFIFFHFFNQECVSVYQTYRRKLRLSLRCRCKEEFSSQLKVFERPLRPLELLQQLAEASRFLPACFLYVFHRPIHHSLEVQDKIFSFDDWSSYDFCHFLMTQAIVCFQLAIILITRYS